MLSYARLSLALLLTAMLLLACASPPPKPTTDFDQEFDFTSIRKLYIMPFNRTAQVSVMVSDMQVQRIDAAIGEELNRRGFEVVSDRRQADLLLTWHLVTRERVDVRAYNSTSLYTCWACRPGMSDVTVRDYTEGTFIVDIIDPMRSRSVWRSITQSRLKAKPDPDQADENRRAAAQAIFATFPPP